MMNWVYLIATLINLYLCAIFMAWDMYESALFALGCGILTAIGYWRS